MRLKSLINGVVLGDFISLHEPLEELLVPANDPIEELHGDIKYTPCQAELLRTNDIEVIDTNIANDIEDDQYCEHSDKHKGALDNSVRYWKDHFNESTDRCMRNHAPNTFRHQFVNFSMRPYSINQCSSATMDQKQGIL